MRRLPRTHPLRLGNYYSASALESLGISTSTTSASYLPLFSRVLVFFRLHKTTSLCYISIARQNSLKKKPPWPLSFRALCAQPPYAALSPCPLDPSPQQPHGDPTMSRPQSSRWANFRVPSSESSLYAGWARMTLPSGLASSVRFQLFVDQNNY
jgi:hypothetical protein